MSVDLSLPFTSLFNRPSLEYAHGEGRGTQKQVKRQSYLTNNMDIEKGKELRPLIQLSYPLVYFHRQMHILQFLQTLLETLISFKFWELISEIRLK